MPSVYLDIVECKLRETLSRRDEVWKNGDMSSAATLSLIIFVLADLRQAIEREDKRSSIQETGKPE